MTVPGGLVAPMLGGNGGGGSVRTKTYQTSDTSTANASAYTFSGKAIGAASSDRRVIVTIHSRSDTGSAPRTISSVTVGGIVATINKDAQGSSRAGSAIVTAAVPIGTTADIVVTFSGGCTQCGIGVYSATGLTSNVAMDADQSTSDPATATLDSTVNGFVIGAVSIISSTTGAAWTNATEDYDTASGANLIMSGASIETSGSAIAPSADYTASASDRVGVFATW